jgi:hypothetical protein
MLSSGFTNAPVAKWFLFGIIAVSIAVSITDSKYLFYIQVVPHLWRYKQAWRLLIWQVCRNEWLVTFNVRQLTILPSHATPIPLKYYLQS